MQKQTTWGLCILSFCLILGVVTPTFAQQAAQAKPPVYTYVAEWATPRAQWADMDKLADEDKALLDKLVTDGTLVSYGFYTNVLHKEGEFTHGSWFSAMSEGSLLKALEAIYKQPSLVGTPAQAASKHWDYMLVDRLYNSKSGSFGGYLALSKWEIKGGEGENYQNLQKSVIVPVLEKLLAEGTITSYGFDMEDYHSQPIGTVWEYITVPDAASLDKANKAFDDVFGSNSTFANAFKSVANREGHQDQLLHLRFMRNK